MKKALFLFVIFISVSNFAQKKDNRTFEEINDSILKEANLIYKYDQIFTKTNQEIDNIKKLRKSVGEIFVYPKGDSIKSIVIHNKDPRKIIAELSIKEIEDTLSLKKIDRQMSDEEFRLINIKYLIFNKIQEDYKLSFSKNQIVNPIYIPFKVNRNGKELELFKMYMLTETTDERTIPFGRDYLFYAQPDGKVFYNLQFNQYMPIQFNVLTVQGDEVLELEYDEREPYITPTDVFLFMKYAEPRGLNNLNVYSTKLNKNFIYNASRELIHTK